MGPNGSGKSTLAQLLAGRDGYEVTRGTVLFDGRDLLALTPEQRAAAGLFLAFQYPVELPRRRQPALLAHRPERLAPDERRRGARRRRLPRAGQGKMKRLQMDATFMGRAVNEGFSGGEKKRNEILQMAVLDPRLAILDETDSGLDIDALRVVANGITAFKREDKALLLITHYPACSSTWCPTSFT